MCTRDANRCAQWWNWFVAFLGLVSMITRALARQRITGIILVLVSLVKPGLGNFHPGDFVQTSRRAQFHGQRTHWHDLLGRHCPKFGQYNVVAIPLPKPKGGCLIASGPVVHLSWMGGL